MPEYAYNQRQNVLLGENVIFDAVIPCTSGYIIHENGTGTFLFRGISAKCSAKYQLHFTGNIAIPTDGTAGEPVALAISVNGEPKMSTRAIITPTVVDNFFQISADTVVDVPRGALFTVAVKAVSGITIGETGTPAPSVDVQNAKLTISKTQ